MLRTASQHTYSSNGLPPRSPEGRCGRCRACGLSLVLVGSRARQPRLPGFRLWAGGGSGECAQTPHTGKDQQGRAATPATTLSPTKRGAGNSPARRLGRCPARRSGSFLRAGPPPALWGSPFGTAAAGLHQGEPAHRGGGRQRRQRVSTDPLCVFLFFWGGLRRPVAFVAGPGGPFHVCWRGRRNHHCAREHRDHATSRAANNDPGNIRNAQQQVSAVPRTNVTRGGAAERRCGPTQKSPCQGYPRTPLARGLTIWRQAM